MVQADICKYIILSDTDRKKGDLQYPHPNVVHRALPSPLPQELQAAMLFADVLREADPCPPPRSWFFLQVHT